MNPTFFYFINLNYFFMYLFMYFFLQYHNEGVLRKHMSVVSKTPLIDQCPGAMLDCICLGCVQYVGGI